MKVILYNNNSDFKVVGKDLSEVWTLDDVYWKENTDILHPVITFDKFRDANDEMVWKQFNYCRIEWNGVPARYYFVHKINLDKGGLIEMHCDIDVRQSWRAWIRDSKFLVARQENIHNKFISDNRIRLTDAKTLESEEIGSQVGSSGGSIILTVSG